MASSVKKKVVVKKDDLRRLMKEKQNSLKTATKKVDHPLAKYNSIGQLVCALCQQQVKTNLLWTAHLNSRSHKDSIARLKADKERKETPSVAPPPPPGSLKRRAETDPDKASSLKRRAETDLDKAKVKGSKGAKHSTESGLPDDFFDSQTQPKSILKNAPKSILKNSAQKAVTSLASYGGSDSEEEGEETPAPAREGVGAAPPKEGLPSDFFDQGVAPPAGTADDEDSAIPQTMAEKLPEGFFDDPKMDAKVRKVEYKDKLDEEWDLFQKVMKEETHVSEAIVQEEDEQREDERNLEEIDEQMQRWSKIDQLAKKKVEIMSKETEKVSEESEEEDLDEQDFEEFLDWRSKKAWK